MESDSLAQLKSILDNCTAGELKEAIALKAVTGADIAEAVASARRASRCGL